MTLPTLVFDFDGTLADTMTAYGQAWNRIAAAYRLKTITTEEIQMLRHKKAQDIMRHLGLSALKLPVVAQRMRQELNRNITEMTVFPGLKEALEHLRRDGYRLGILTSNSADNVSAFLRHRNLELFDFIYSGSRIFGKSTVMKHLLKKHALHSGEVIYICDEVRDLEASRKAGIRTVAVAWGFNSADVLARENPDALIHDPDELFPAVTSLV